MINKLGCDFIQGPQKEPVVSNSPAIWEHGSLENVSNFIGPAKRYLVYLCNKLVLKKSDKWESGLFQCNPPLLYFIFHLF